MNIKQYLIPAVTATLLAVSASAWTSVAQAEASKSSTSLTEQKTQMDKTKILKEAVTVLEKTNTALQQLEQGKKQQALDTLAIVTGKLELLVAQHPDLAFAPVDVQMIVHDYIGTDDDVQKIRKQAYKLLKDGKLQQARHLIEDVASEIVVRTTSLPLLTYPDAIKAVAPLIEKSDAKAAQVALQNALSTVVVSDDIIPLPVLRAQTALTEAKKLAKVEKRDDKQAERLASLLHEAHQQLVWSEALGYGDKASFEDLYDAIDTLEKKTAKNGSEQGLFDRLSETIKHMF